VPWLEEWYLKYITKGKVVYDEYYNDVLRCSLLWDILPKPIISAKMVHFLDSWQCLVCKLYAPETPGDQEGKWQFIVAS
jgi:hypothetical protein